MPMMHSPESDYRVIFSMCALATVAITPFTAYHVATGAWLMAAITGTAALFTGAALVSLFRNRRDAGLIGRVGKVIVLVSNVSVLAGTIVKPDTTFYWLYPLVFINFYLLPLTLAVAVNVTASAVVLWATRNMLPPDHLSRLAATIPLCLFFGLVFSSSVLRQRRELHHLAHHDVLTGVGNRLALDLALEEAAERLRRYRETCSLIILDIDRFKAVNDAVGHLKGDAVISEFARLVNGRIRKADRLFRFGGEEFLIVLPHTAVPDARHLAESLRAVVEQHDFGVGGRITASGGVAELGAREDVEDWLGRADRALFSAKRAGRNRIHTSDSSTVDVESA